MGWILGTKRLSEWERLRLHGRCGYVGTTRFLMTKILLLCRSSTGVRLYSVHGRHFSVWRIVTSLWRCLHDRRTRPRSLFPNMGGYIVGGLKPTERHNSWLLSFFLYCMSMDPRLLNSCVHPGYAEAGCNCFPQSNKASFIEKKWGATGWE
jgi:hypothetical protein